MIDLETHGRKRVLPTFGSTPVARIDEAEVRKWMTKLIQFTVCVEVSPAQVEARFLFGALINALQVGVALRMHLRSGGAIPSRAFPTQSRAVFKRSLKRGHEGATDVVGRARGSRA